MKVLNYDAAIIGSGVIGCAVARELARYDLSICVIEKEEDVCSGTSKSNSAIVHAGHDAVPGSLKARFNVEGNRMMGELSKELDFSLIRNGSLVLCFSEEDMPALKKLYEKGVKNGVPGLAILTGDEVRAMEPNVTETVVAALYAPSGGIVCPFGLTIALAENACDNGVEFLFNTEVKEIEKTEKGFDLKTGEGIIHAAYVVNAAGVYADRIHNMVSEEKIRIKARKGDYCLLDKEAGNHVSHTIFQLPGKMGKGVLVTPTVHGNLLTGPTATDVEDKEWVGTTAKELSDIMEKAAWGVKNIPFRQIITSFSGLRAHESGDDFILGEVSGAPGFFDAAGIESPGLTSAPAIGVYIAELVARKAEASKKENYKGTRKGILDPQKLSFDERAELIKKNPQYGTIICRCEGVSEGEIVDAITRTLGAVSLDGIKRRVRAGMGRCQAGFCAPKTMEILARETGREMEDICKNRPGSNIVTGHK
ncbi:NAD(P)/FAD-dependent oxidoreductase [Lacrimispora saccharolytica]|uniref:FAD dependent oxidoreductase n=1 Tax=Lacrimispora saccharolytica (strain ATCC 35040 / DSM 2544 / NRCC 2533 / WM1) TaxID=610130 RepID=D9R2I6_LACSW|nr:NAD(P)/FAD-dependent oxidoreductase [Lacrimispora saccharolytica]ADL06610.1 FAD dependent oxidoreductase [[Clostridium] saccharolyticum WM1]QRV19316.1 NAD(P)/FAD-dependent oxidoreductase [Lacrimispora saccharolytica]